MNLYCLLSQPILVVIMTNIGSSPLSIEMDFNLREVGHKESPGVVKLLRGFYAVTVSRLTYFPK